MINGVRPKNTYLPQGWEFTGIGPCPFGAKETCAVFNYNVRNLDGTPSNEKIILPDVQAYSPGILTKLAAKEFDHLRGNIPRAEILKALGELEYEQIMSNAPLVIEPVARPVLRLAA